LAAKKTGFSGVCALPDTACVLGRSCRQRAAAFPGTPRTGDSFCIARAGVDVLRPGCPGILTTDWSGAGSGGRHRNVI